MYFKFLYNQLRIEGFLQVCKVYRKKTLCLICMYIFHTCTWYLNLHLYLYLFLYLYFPLLRIILNVFKGRKRLCFINILLVHNIMLKIYLVLIHNCWIEFDWKGEERMLSLFSPTLRCSYAMAHWIWTWKQKFCFWAFWLPVLCPLAII